MNNILPTRRRHLLRWTSLLAVAALFTATAWWITQPWRAAAQTPTAAAGIHKVKDTVWRADLGAPLFIAVLGSDIRNGAPGGPGGRCDALHIVAINPQSKAGSVIDIPRDSYVDIPGHGKQRINTGCFYGGTEFQVQVLKNVTGIPIHYYVTTEFSHFMQFIDELGGIDINVPYPMNDPPSAAFFGAGPQHMNGGQALAFNRNRKNTPNGDFSRTENQGAFIIQSLAKFRNETANDSHRMIDYLRVARRHVKITVPLPDLIKLGLLAREIDPANIRNLPVGGSTGKAGEASVVFMDPGDIFVRVRDDAIY